MATLDIPPLASTGRVDGAGPSVWLTYAPAIAIALSFAPLLVLFGVDLWARPHYQFFPVAIPLAGALIWKFCRHLGTLEPGSAAVAWGFAALGWLLLVIGVAFVTPWFGAVGVLAALLGTAYALGGRRLTVAVLPAWAFLWLVIPPPRRYDFLLINSLQRLVGLWSSELLDAAGIYHAMDGNVVLVNGRELLVDHACSGIYSLFTLLVGTIFYVLWMRVSPIRAAVLAGASVLWVLLGNVARIVLIVLLSTRFGIDAASGWKHEVLGLFMFVVMLGLVLSTDRFEAFVVSVYHWLRAVLRRPGGIMAAMLAPESFAIEGKKEASDRMSFYGVPTAGVKPPASKAGVEAAPKSAALAAPIITPGPAPAPAAAPKEPTVLPSLRRTWLGSPLAGAFGLLMVVPQFMLPGAPWSALFQDTEVYVKRFSAMSADSMPERVGPFVRGGFQIDEREWGNSWGQHSRFWNYRASSRVASISLDYYFVGWHELTDCYLGRGWRMTDRVNALLPAPAGGKEPGVPVVAAAFTNVEGRHGFLVYELFNPENRPLELPETKGLRRVLRDRLEGWTRSGQTVSAESRAVTYQLQVFAEAGMPPTPDEKAAIFALFNQARERVTQVGRRAEGTKP